MGLQHATLPCRTDMARVPHEPGRGRAGGGFLASGRGAGQRLYALAFLKHDTRRLHITGITAHPTRERTVQQARNVTADLGKRMESLCFLPRDHDGEYGQSFDAVLPAEEMKILKNAPQAPRMNAHCERVIDSIRREALDHVRILNAAHARKVLATAMLRYLIRDADTQLSPGQWQVAKLGVWPGSCGRCGLDRR
jgi:hypothetical protein